jgi:hypothetical protein
MMLAGLRIYELSLGVRNGQAMNAHAVWKNCENRATLKQRAPAIQKPLHEIRYCFSPQALDTDTDDRGTGSATNGQQRMKIGVQREHNAAFLQGQSQNLCVLCRGTANLPV